MRDQNRALVFVLAVFIGAFELSALGCSEDHVVPPPKDSPVGITGTWTGSLGDAALEMRLIEWASGPITGEIVVDSRGPSQILKGAEVRGDTVLVPFDCQGLCQNYFVGTVVGADSLAGNYYYWAPQPPLDGYPILSWHAHRNPSR